MYRADTGDHYTMLWSIADGTHVIEHTENENSHGRTVALAAVHWSPVVPAHS